MSEHKRAYVFQGPGLLRDGGLDPALRALGFEIRQPYLLPTQPLALDMPLSRNDLLVFRASWNPSAEEILYARQLGSRVKELGKALRAKPVSERPVVIGVGRWAVALLFAEWTSLKTADVSRLHWGELGNEFRPPWTEVSYGAADTTYPARLQGRVLPDLPAEFEPSLKATGGKNIGWSFEGATHLFFADPLAFAHGSQLEGFGYENQEKVSNNTNFLRSLLGSRDA
jgi:hypothetical protein